MTTNRYQTMWGWLLTSPYLLYALVFFLVPLVWGGGLAFLRWDLISPTHPFVGLENFAAALRSPRVRAAAVTPFAFMAVFLPLTLLGSLTIALLINSVKRFQGLLAVAFFLPYLASGVAVALIVRGVLAYDSAFSSFLRGTVGSSPNWLQNPFLAVLIIGLMIAWKFSGYFALIFLAGLQGIPKELYEAADIDGATGGRKLVSVTLPMLYPAFYTIIILSVGQGFSIFTEPYILTGGGPGLATQTWYLEIYSQLFTSLKAGYASSIALLNAAEVFIAVLLVRRVMRWWGGHYGGDQEA